MFGQKKTSIAKFALTFTLGAIAGAAIALLYTPVTGKKFQKKVVDVTEKVIDKVDDLQQTVRKLATA